MGDLAVGQLSFDDAINDLFVKARSDVSSLPPQDLRRLNHALLKFYFAKEEMRAPELIVRPLHSMAFVLLASAEMVSSNVVLMINIVKKPMMIAEKLKNQWLACKRSFAGIGGRGRRGRLEPVCGWWTKSILLYLSLAIPVAICRGVLHPFRNGLSLCSAIPRDCLYHGVHGLSFSGGLSYVLRQTWLG